MTMVDNWPRSASSAGIRGSTGVPNIVRIAAGSSSIGAHSMAIDKEGRLFGWGVAYAVGLGVVKAITSPAQVLVGSFRNSLHSTTEGR